MRRCHSSPQLKQQSFVGPPRAIGRSSTAASALDVMAVIQGELQFQAVMRVTGYSAGVCMPPARHFPKDLLLSTNDFTREEIEIVGSCLACPPEGLPDHDDELTERRHAMYSCLRAKKEEEERSDDGAEKQ